jgi:hypothetical protein
VAGGKRIFTAGKSDVCSVDAKHENGVKFACQVAARHFGLRVALRRQPVGNGAIAAKVIHRAIQDTAWPKFVSSTRGRSIQYVMNRRADA